MSSCDVIICCLDRPLQCFLKIICTKSLLMARFLLNAFRPHVCKQHNNCAVNGVKLQSEHFIFSKSCSFLLFGSCVKLTCLMAHLWNLLRLTWQVFVMYNLIHLHPGCLNGFHCLIYCLYYTINLLHHVLIVTCCCGLVCA